ncbi:MAG: hypothetical protein U1E81_16075 [Xanthobacteraceae bacterium]
MPIDRLQRGRLMSGGERYTVLCIAFSKAAIEREQSPQEALRSLDELMRLAPADVVRAIPPMSPAAVRIVLEAGKLDPPEGKQVVVDDQVKLVPLYPEEFCLLTGPLFWEIAAMTPGMFDALLALEDALRPPQAATPATADSTSSHKAQF